MHPRSADQSCVFPNTLRRKSVWKYTGLIDRKSTRLNSSHQIISYAVFCLKKKNHHPNVIDRKLDQAPIRVINVSDALRDVCPPMHKLPDRASHPHMLISDLAHLSLEVRVM